MTDVLFDYLEICKRYPADAFLNSVQQKERHCALMKWKKQEYRSMPNIDEIMAFINTNDSLHYEQPFFIKVLVPCVKKDINEGNTQTIKFLIERNGKDHARIGTTRDYITIFCAETNFQHTEMELADMVLLKEPDNEIVLYYKYTLLKRRLQFSIHEVPYGVGMGVTDPLYLKKELSTFISLSEKLCKDDKNLIQECTTMYVAWEQYLNHIENYKNFEDYLIKHTIPY